MLAITGTIRYFRPLAPVDSKPQPDTCGEKAPARLLFFCSGEIRCATKFLLPHKPNVWCELPSELVTKPESGFSCAEARTDASPRIGFPGEINLPAWLQNQAVRNQQFVLSLQAGFRPSGRTNVSGSLDFKKGRRQPLNPNRCPRLSGAGAEILTYSCNKVPPAGKGATVKQMSFRLVDTPPLAFALCAKPKTVHISADPAYVVPTYGAFLVVVPPFQMVKQQKVVHLTIVSSVSCDVRKCCSSVFVSQHRYRCQWLLRPWRGCRGLLSKRVRRPGYQNQSEQIQETYGMHYSSTRTSLIIPASMCNKRWQ